MVLTGVATVMMVAMSMNKDSLALLQLFQLVSPSLPVGGYAWSQGLEYAIESGWLKTESDVADWMAAMLLRNLACLDIPVLARAFSGWQAGDLASVDNWNAFLYGSRETLELSLEDVQMGKALARLLAELNIDEAKPWQCRDDAGYAVLFALAACKRNILLQDACLGYLWSWCDNQVAVALKLFPLGQTAGQRLFQGVVSDIPVAVEKGLALGDDEIGSTLPGYVLSSVFHETQYSRLFRS